MNLNALIFEYFKRRLLLVQLQALQEATAQAVSPPLSFGQPNEPLKPRVVPFAALPGQQFNGISSTFEGTTHKHGQPTLATFHLDHDISHYMGSEVEGGLEQERLDELRN